MRDDGFPGRRIGVFNIRHAARVLELLDTDGRRLHALFWRTTRRDDVAQDLMQELTMKLATSDGFVEADHPYAYARRAAINLAMDWHRATGRFGDRSMEFVHDEAAFTTLLGQARSPEDPPRWGE